jgi:hypothetical protein
MEPLDPNLTRKFSEVIKKYEDAEVIRSAAMLGKINPHIKEGSLEGKLALYVHRSRKGDVVKKIDRADYKLTVEILGLIKDACCCTLEDLRSHKRDSGLTIARSLFAFLERRLNKRSTTEIGALINKDHTSILHLKYRFRDYSNGKIFEVYMKNARLKELYNKARSGV